MRNITYPLLRTVYVKQASSLLDDLIVDTSQKFVFILIATLFCF